MSRTSLPKNATPEQKLQRRVLRAQERSALRPSAIDPNQQYRLDETAAALGISLALLHLEIKAGKITTNKHESRRKTTVGGAEIIRVSLGTSAVGETHAA